jgi:hypothetical protein
VLAVHVRMGVYVPSPQLVLNYLQLKLCALFSSRFLWVVLLACHFTICRYAYFRIDFISIYWLYFPICFGFDRHPQPTAQRCSCGTSSKCSALCLKKLTIMWMVCELTIYSYLHNTTSYTLKHMHIHEFVGHPQMTWRRSTTPATASIGELLQQRERRPITPERMHAIGLAATPRARVTVATTAVRIVKRILDRDYVSRLEL